MTPEIFDDHRARLFGLAYRMLGSVQDADDVVQEAWLRWHRAHDVMHPRAWLDTVCTRLCLDAAKRAHRQRETYPGPWLPEPWVEAEEPTASIDSTITMALLLVLQRLSPPQRAAFLLREVFEADYTDISAILDASEATCRQWVRRARRQVVVRSEPRFVPTPEALDALVVAFGVAATTGDREALEAQLTADVVAWSDGGGKRPAATRGVTGPSRVAQLLLGTQRKQPQDVRLALVRVNGGPGVVVDSPSQGLQAVLAFAVRADDTGRACIAGIYTVRNPDKLGHLAASTTPPEAGGSPRPRRS